jgi:calcineurin-like phosphoesterase family protein
MAWFTSDTHFLHPFVARLRGFPDPAAHDEEIITRWNAVVRPDDLVWHLGDVGMGPPGPVLTQVARLNGRIHLITGNHDPCWPGHRDSRKVQRRWMEAFESVQAYAKIRLGDDTVLLSHFPYEGGGDHTAEERYKQYRFRDEGAWLLHGHTHLPDRLDGPHQIHVGLDAWGLRPVTDTVITGLIKVAGITGLELHCLAEPVPDLEDVPQQEPLHRRSSSVQLGLHRLQLSCDRPEQVAPLRVSRHRYQYFGEISRAECHLHRPAQYSLRADCQLAVQADGARVAADQADVRVPFGSEWGTAHDASTPGRSGAPVTGS